MADENPAGELITGSVEQSIVCEVIKMFNGTPYKYGYTIADKGKSAGIGFGNGYSTYLLREIYINFVTQEIRYARCPALSRDIKITKKFKKLSEIVIPKTVEEFDAFIGWV